MGAAISYHGVYGICWRHFWNIKRLNCISETGLLIWGRGQQPTVSIDSQLKKKRESDWVRQPPFHLYSFSSHFFFLPTKFRRLTMESALLQNSPFTISDDQFDPSTVDLLADAIFSNSIQRNKARRSTAGDDKRKFDQVDGAIRSANPPKTTREFRCLLLFHYSQHTHPY